jgi:hypothetical protein
VVSTSNSAGVGASTTKRPPDVVALVVVWGARLAWLSLGLFAGGAVGQALASNSRAVQLTGTVLAWIGWGAVAAALLVPSALALTIVRTSVPVCVVVAVALPIAGADATAAALFAACALVATFATTSGELGQVFVQASAYGDEHRFPLRPPVPYLVPTVLSWVVWCASLLCGPLMLAAGSVVAGIPVTAVAVVLTWFLGRRYHRLSRRWLVLVPAGLVIHDHVVLAETAMFPQRSRGAPLARTRRLRGRRSHRTCRRQTSSRSRSSICRPSCWPAREPSPPGPRSTSGRCSSPPAGPGARSPRLRGGSPVG